MNIFGKLSSPIKQIQLLSYRSTSYSISSSYTNMTSTRSTRSRTVTGPSTTDSNSVTKPKPKSKATKLETALVSKVIPNSHSTDPQPPQPKSQPKHQPDSQNGNRRYWLIKSEPTTRIDPKTGKDVKFPLSDMVPLEAEPWTGVRNYEARNNMIHMSQGDWCLFYHSNCQSPGIVGLVEVSKGVSPDPEQFNVKSGYYDSKSTRENPKWWCVDVKFVRRFKAKVTLEECRANPKLQEMGLVKRGRLSVTDLSKEHFLEVLRMEDEKDIDDLSLDCVIDRKFIDMPEN
ncbi:hypothetical protein WICPIJ_001173 [Wickerhamomyces pijperi]|uniref:EVE domain-containing protein n=1 Tax=Wickerhamomyces pijperi TaxID=599730 RepID=A0A9P8QEI9_WICPI|nr:hypothetical protein WICPIJ_001173 [Wickerhamomyces pijperi]